MQPQLVTTPENTEHWLQEKMSSARESITIVAPYVGGILEESLPKRASEVQVRLITSLKVNDVISGATNIHSIFALASQRVQIQSISNLHAKVYMVDNYDVLVTSANATYNGWRSNLEIGLATQNTEIAQQINHLLKQARPYPWTTPELKRYAEWASANPKLGPQPRTVSTDIIKGAFEGWLKLAINGVEQLSEEFSLTDAYEKLLPLAAVHYPQNKHPKEKIRQQLQGLRDLGLLEFVSPGRYRRLTIET